MCIKRLNDIYCIIDQYVNLQLILWIYDGNLNANMLFGNNLTN